MKKEYDSVTVTVELLVSVRPIFVSTTIEMQKMLGVLLLFHLLILPLILKEIIPYLPKLPICGNTNARLHSTMEPRRILHSKSTLIMVKLQLMK